MNASGTGPRPDNGGNDGGWVGLFVRRPILATVLNLLIIIAGIAALGGIEVRELPDVDRPVVTVRTSYAGATPESMDAQITAIIESAVSRVPGVTEISSKSQYGRSRVRIEFSSDTSLEAAATDVRDAVAGIANRLPDDMKDQRRDQGADVDSAIRDAAVTRLRPVIMTMTSTVLGALPLVLATGAGAESRLALGWVIIGGLGFATLFTLFLTPVTYRLLAPLSKPRAHEAQLLTEELRLASR